MKNLLDKSAKANFKTMSITVLIAVFVASMVLATVVDDKYVDAKKNKVKIKVKCNGHPCKVKVKKNGDTTVVCHHHHSFSTTVKVSC
jgi:hypothetical protein